MTDLPELGDNRIARGLREAIAASPERVNALAKRAKVSRATIYRIAGGKNPNIRTTERLTLALDQPESTQVVKLRIADRDTVRLELSVDVPTEAAIRVLVILQEVRT